MRTSGFLFAQSETPYPAPPMPIVYERAEPTRWAYHTVAIDLREQAPLADEQLNALGAEGWLLVGTIALPTRDAAHLTYYFVRPA